MAIMGLGAVLGLASLAGLIWAFRKLPPPKKWVAVAGFLVLGAVGAFLAANATALGGPDVTEDLPGIDDEDFDAPLDDDWGDGWDDDHTLGDEAALGDDDTLGDEAALGDDDTLGDEAALGDDDTP